MRPKCQKKPKMQDHHVNTSKNDPSRSAKIMVPGPVKNDTKIVPKLIFGPFWETQGAKTISAQIIFVLILLLTVAVL